MRLTGRVVTPSGVLENGYVEVTGDRIAAVGTGGPGGPEWIVPGFVDIHVHGGGGYSFTTGDPGAASRLMRDATVGFAPLVAEGALAGIHYEGPYLSAVRCGAQNPAHLRDPSTEELAGLLDAGGDAVRMVTIAPERDGALDAIKLLTARGVVAAVGHTDATYEQTLAAVDAGARVATHLFNGMRPPHHRDPGPVLALLGRAEVTCELIADGVHLHDGTLAFAAAVAGPDRTALVTDAIDAAGMADGRYELGGQAVVVERGVARLATADGSAGSIAGSTLTMDAALRRAVHAGISMEAACRMASTTPARAIGLGRVVGALAPGLRADLVVLDANLGVARVMRAGAWVR
jgi:N-acetylglucosamine-6-phosphate deacetylase